MILRRCSTVALFSLALLSVALLPATQLSAQCKPDSLEKQIDATLQPAELLLPADVSLPAEVLLPAEGERFEERSPSGSVEEHPSFGKRLLKPFKWIFSNWRSYDTLYSVPCFYDFTFQVQNTSAYEYLNLVTPDGMKAEMHSRWSHRLGPYVGWSFLFGGISLDLNAAKDSRAKTEFNFSLNSNMFSLDLFYRKTGGDFIVERMTYPSVEVEEGEYEFIGSRVDSETNEYFSSLVSDEIYNNVTGFNLNFFLNHRRFSNPAAFSNGAIQLRSCGSPFIGIGYTHQKLDCYYSNILAMIGLFSLEDESGNSLLSTGRGDYGAKFSQWLENEESTDEELLDIVRGLVADNYDVVSQVYNADARRLLLNISPTTMRVDDWRLQLGYAYNIVLSQRCLIGLSAAVAPSIKVYRANNAESFGYQLISDKNFYERYIKPIAAHPNYKFRHTSVGINYFAKASFTYTYDHWIAGAIANYSNLFYRSNGTRINNGYFSLGVYVGYTFGRKAQFRKGGKNWHKYREITGKD